MVTALSCQIKIETRVQIISVQDKAAVKEYKAWETTRHNKISDGYHGSTCTTTLLALL